MNLKQLDLKGVIFIETNVFRDGRGEFAKIFHRDTFLESNLNCEFVEGYYSTSNKGVIRGMHFQSHPHAHAKLVYVTSGAILDVILDLRTSSETYGKHISVELDDSSRSAIYIPVGCAHGFLSLEDGTCVNYLQTTQHMSSHDHGVHYDSFGFDWGVKNPILSERDKGFPALSNYESDFA